MTPRYKELFSLESEPVELADVPYDLKGYLTEIDTGKIDADYMNSRFQKYIKLLDLDETLEEQVEQAKEELHRAFATLTQEEQKCANIFLHDRERGDIQAKDGMDL